MATPSAALLRQLFPSWEFFDVAKVPPSLEFRTCSETGGWTAWTPAIQAPHRRWWHVLFNPEGTSTLAAQTLVERWYVEMIELGPDAVDTTTSLALVNAIVRYAIRQHRTHDSSAAPHRWQLRLIVTDEEQGAAEIMFEQEHRAVACHTVGA